MADQIQIRDSLLPQLSTGREHKVEIRPVSQVNFILHPIDGNSPFEKAISMIVYWMGQRTGQPLPAAAHAGRSFSVDEIGAQPAEAVSIPARRYWAAKMIDADRNIPQRNWVTEVGLAAQDDGSVLFGCRLQATFTGEYTPFDRTIPKFVKSIVEHNLSCLDGCEIDIKPRFVDTDEEVDDLLKLLHSSGRKHDVVVLSLPEGSNDWNATAIPVDKLAWQLTGAAHVAVLNQRASFRLTDIVGKQLSVFRQGIRTYRPGFDPDTDEPFAHPLGLAHRILDWEGGAEGYAGFLVNRILGNTVSGSDLNHRLPRFSDAKRIERELLRKETDNSVLSLGERLDLAETEIDQLKKETETKVSEYTHLLILAETERDEALQAGEQAKQNNYYLRQRITDLETRLSDQGNESLQLPDDLEDFEEWCRKNLTGSVEVHNRAFQGVKKSSFEDVSLIYNSLILLRDYYVPMRREGGMDTKEEFARQCQLLGLEEQPSFSGNGWGEHGETYIVKYGGSRVLLDRHLKKGTSKDQRYCFRLYFAWDDKDSHVIVGWLPSHLETRAT